MPKSKVNTIFSGLANTPLGISIRNLLGVRPVYFRRLKSNLAISDLFSWRLDEDWETRFDLMNISSLLLPEKNVGESVRVVIFDQYGEEVTRLEYRLEPFETKTILFDELMDRNVHSFGSFSVIHVPDDPHLMAPYKTCICERGYVGYKRRSAPIDCWSFVHGNWFVLAGKFDDPHSYKIPVREHVRGQFIYRPQLRLDDCLKVELVYVNQSDRQQVIELKFYDESNALVNSQVYDMNPFSSIKLTLEDVPFRIESHSNIFVLRPCIFKFYESHFDVLHS